LTIEFLRETIGDYNRPFLVGGGEVKTLELASLVEGYIWWALTAGNGFILTIAVFFPAMFDTGSKASSNDRTVSSSIDLLSLFKNFF